jgi:hypothetical protein
MELRLRDGDVVRILSVEKRHGKFLFFDTVEEDDVPGCQSCVILDPHEAQWMRDALDVELRREPVGPLVRMMECAA